MSIASPTTALTLSLTTVDAHAIDAEAVIVGLDSSGTLNTQAKRLDAELNQVIAHAVEHKVCSGELGELWHWSDFDKQSQFHVIVVGLGDHKACTSDEFMTAMSDAFAKAKALGAKHIASYVHQGFMFSTNQAVKHSAAAAHYANYSFGLTKSPKKSKAIRVSLGVSKKQHSSAKQALAAGDALGRGVNLSRELGNLPANICTPTFLAKQAERIARGHKNISVRIHNEADMKKLGMRTLLSVAQGSEEPAKLIELKYNGSTAKAKPVVLVGKGLTFDTGGVSIKGAAGMEEMKYDMGGGAAVLGVFEALALYKPNINVVGLVPATENHMNGRATRPGDVVESMSGKTVEIINTDAEGRLILCDTLTYAARFKPKHMIDMATLTGACIIALGDVHSAVMSNTETLRDNLQSAGNKSGDLAWPLPLHKRYHKQLKSPAADIKNVGGKPAGSITAGCFLENFVGDIPWAHLDIAGSYWKTGDTAGATGRPVGLLWQHILEEAKEGSD